MMIKTHDATTGITGFKEVTSVPAGERYYIGAIDMNIDDVTDVAKLIAVNKASYIKAAAHINGIADVEGVFINGRVLTIPILPA